jgi:hypothetical protein
VDATADRRRLPRRECRYQVALEFVGDDPPLLCETVDLSPGGVRVHASVFRIPEGRCLLVLVTSDTSAPIVLGGDVVEEIIDAGSGDVSARIVFRRASDAARQRVTELVLR